MTEKKKHSATPVWQYYRAHKRDFSMAADHKALPYFSSLDACPTTQVSRVRSFYPRFLKQFPHHAPRTSGYETSRAWQGLGYNRRALNLQRAAEIITRAHAGKVRNVEELKALPGIGPGPRAILAFVTITGLFMTNARIAPRSRAMPQCLSSSNVSALSRMSACNDFCSALQVKPRRL